VYFIRPTVLSLILAAGVAGVAGPAAAKDCFIRVKTGEMHAPPPVRRPAVHHAAAVAPRPHLVHHIRHVVGHPHVKRPQVLAAAPAEGPHYAESSLLQRSIPIYEMRPVACDSHPGIQSLAPGLAKPPAQRLLDALVTPAALPPPVEEQGLPVILVPDTAIPGAPGGVPIGGVGGPPPIVVSTITPPIGQPGGPPPVVTPPVGPPPVTPPVVVPPVGPPPVTPPVTPPVPPVTPPVTPPGPPPVTPPVTPPVVPPETPPPVVVVTPPGPPGGPPPVSPVPEPSTWALLMLGFLGLGGVLRARRAAAIRKATFQ